MQRRIYKLVNPRTQDQRAVDGQRDADEKPNRNHVASVDQKIWLPENNVQRDQNDSHDGSPENRLLVQRDVPYGWNFRQSVYQTS